MMMFPTHRRWLFSVAMAGALLAAPLHADVYFVDLSDAYEQSVALKQLLADVDQSVTRVRDEAERQRAPLLEEIEALKTSRMSAEAQKQRRRELLLALAAIEQTSAERQARIGKANELAMAKVDEQVAKIEAELKVELKAQAIFRSQDLLYFRAGSPRDLSATLYQRLNQTMPKLSLELPP